MKSLILTGMLLALPAFSGGMDYVKEGRAIRQRIAAYTEAARTGNSKAAATFLTAEYDSVGGERAANPEVRQIRFVRPDLALVDGAIAGANHTWVMEKRNGAWMITASRQGN